MGLAELELFNFLFFRVFSLISISSEGIFP